MFTRTMRLGSYAEGLRSVTTSIEINANVSTVWENVIRFPQLEEPSEFIFRSGIAYVNKIQPGLYWTLWSDYIVHKIHGRVLEHIRTLAERSS